MQGGDRQLTGSNEPTDELPCGCLVGPPVRRQAEPLAPTAATSRRELAAAPEAGAKIRRRVLGVQISLGRHRDLFLHGLDDLSGLPG
jgi:hypothetical protein